MRDLVNEQDLLKRKPAENMHNTSVIVCGTKCFLAGEDLQQQNSKDPVYRLWELLHQYAKIDGKEWIPPGEPLPADILEKIESVRVCECRYVPPPGELWMIEAVRDKDGIGISATHRISTHPLGKSPKPEDVIPPTRFPLSEAQWNEMIEIIRNQDILHWKPKPTEFENMESCIHIKSVEDRYFPWYLSLDEDPKSKVLADEMRRLYGRPLPEIK